MAADGPIADLALGELYASEKFGSDDGADGSDLKPFKTVLKLMHHFAKGDLCESFPSIYVDSKEEGKTWDPITKAQLKKVKKLYLSQVRKEKSCTPSTVIPSAADALEEAKKVKIELDQSLPQALLIKIKDSKEGRGKRVKVQGWVHRVRKQGKSLMFVVMRDGTGFLQCVMNNKQAQTYEALVLSTESTITVYGVVTEVPQGQSAPGGHELMSDYWELIKAAPAGGGDLNEESHVDFLFDNRHLMLRWETPAKIMRMCGVVKECFREHFAERGYTEVSPPAFVKGQVEGGSTLFKVPYFDDVVYLTQSSQLYLETCLPLLGDVYCMESSFRAERSRTRRHLAQYTHVEAECAFISFEDLLCKLEDLICDVSLKVLERAKEQLLELNADFKAPTKPFKRMDYKDAIEFLREHDIRKEDGSTYEFGEDIPEAPERRMTDLIGEPIMLCRFPAAIKAFYMQKDPDDRRVTESVDILIPGVGEIVGGSMRIDDIDELLEGYKREGIDPGDYKYYTDQRVYGSCPHGGYGLGFERFVTWMFNRHHIRDVCLYPRYIGRCNP